MKLNTRIYGLGVDLIEIPRMKKALDSRKEKFLARIAHPVERKSAPQGVRQYEYWASRFAAKEAFAKALGTGIGATVSLTSVGVRSLPSGQPQLVFSEKLARELKKHSIIKTHLSLSHTGQTAMAVVILERA